VHYTDLDVFATELCSFGDDVLVLNPAPLRERVLSNLDTVVSDHA
jgi:predicted DNA-binding transcriptional regulator YafY